MRNDSYANWSQTGRMDENLKNWLEYDCFLAVLPALLVYGFHFLYLAGNKFSQILRDGQLYFYCSALLTTALGDLSRPETPAATLKLVHDWNTGFLMLLLTVSFFFGAGTYYSASQAHTSPSARATTDLKTAQASVIFALSTTLLVGYFRFRFKIW